MPGLDKPTRGQENCGSTDGAGGQSNLWNTSMSPLATAAVVMAATFSAALLGIAVQRWIPAQHRENETKDTVRIAIGTIAALTALVLGLSTSSAKVGFDLACRNLHDSTIDLIMVDRLLARYGDEATGLRHDIQELVRRRLGWLADLTAQGEDAYNPLSGAAMVEGVADRIHDLEPRDARQQALKERLVALAEAALRSRWSLAAEQDNRVPPLFLVAVGSWLVIMFFSYGLFARWNATVLVALLACALSASIAVFLIMELERPFSGFIRVPAAGLRRAQEVLGK